jgi:uncharacterized protein
MGVRFPPGAHGIEYGAISSVGRAARLHREGRGFKSLIAHKIMKRVFLIHGYKGNPKNHWFPWVVSELEKKKGVLATAFSMPNSESPSVSEWVKTMEEKIENPDEETFLIGHSLGVAAILGFIEALTENKKVGGIVLVSGGFSDRFSTDYESVKEKTESIVVIHAKDDNMVSYEKGKEMSERLNAKLITLDKGGHFTTKDNKFEFPEVRDELLSIMNKKNTQYG